ncbi:hypothetical protein [Streptomyces sp. NPDC029674]|uniref:hypothetical protein n=1 Tax=Streptomyces sp. NPDC029674 TaxID=3365297 RepID=UPI00384FABCA
MDNGMAVALIGAIGVGGTIVGTFTGTVLGARIQARGGHDQAQSARDAAEGPEAWRRASVAQAAGIRHPDARISYRQVGPGDLWGSCRVARSME